MDLVEPPGDPLQPRLLAGPDVGAGVGDGIGANTPGQRATASG